ncbi:hypothetical protein FHX81_7763 [Saccharothrix saharensis]|uniref:Type 2A encapsulin shell protein SrpI-like domain-containing protein n=1 Tax=Saccharothrix saharensis TaxID=571190 RepID=A0A543JR92_9PSEU|nr:hypothetical protein FHX81_7763 [Saccharothrix saharensis]
MLVTLAEPVVAPDAPRTRLSLGPAAARNLATTTGSVPRTQAVSSRRLLKVLPRIEAKGGAFRVDRRLGHGVGDGRVTFVDTGSGPAVVPAEPGGSPLPRGFDEPDVPAAPADRSERREHEPGDVVVEAGARSDEAFLIVHGRLHEIGAGDYGDPTEGVIGPHQTGLPHEREPGLTVKDRGTDAKAVTSYLVTAHHSVAVLVPDTRGGLDDVGITR